LVRSDIPVTAGPIDYSSFGFVRLVFLLPFRGKNDAR
jgi:hypothetical protein